MQASMNAREISCEAAGISVAKTKGTPETIEELEKAANAFKAGPVNGGHLRAPEAA